MTRPKFAIYVAYDNNVPIRQVDENIEEIHRLEFKTVDHVRELIAAAYCLRKDRLEVIHDAQDLTVQAQNALLKIAEEPPEKFYLALKVDSLQKIIPTILSRAQIFVNRENDCCEEAGNTDLISLAKKLFDNLGKINEANVLNVLNHVDKEKYQEFLDILKDTWAEKMYVTVDNTVTVKLSLLFEYDCICNALTQIKPSTNIERLLNTTLLNLWRQRQYAIQPAKN